MLEVMRTSAPAPTDPRQHRATGPTPRRRRGPYLTALLWGDLGMLAGAATAYLVALPFRPDDDGWDELGWALAALALGAVLGVLFGAVALWRGLRRFEGAHPLATALTFVPLAVLTAAVSAGVGALAAPPLAHWLVVRAARLRDSRAGAQDGYGTVGYGPAGHRPAR